MINTKTSQFYLLTAGTEFIISSSLAPTLDALFPYYEVDEEGIRTGLPVDNKSIGERAARNYLADNPMYSDPGFVAPTKFHNGLGMNLYVWNITSDDPTHPEKIMDELKALRNAYESQTGQTLPVPIGYLVMDTYIQKAFNEEVV